MKAVWRRNNNKIIPGDCRKVLEEQISHRRRIDKRINNDMAERQDLEIKAIKSSRGRKYV